mmetsp:Transcript_58568/g.127202  ORF Transcript_58568/g.127202 Transcript_58568/m.127202 type:complete len:254 (-) Transcript_58568:2-763(-)
MSASALPCCWDTYIIGCWLVRVAAMSSHSRDCCPLSRPEAMLAPMLAALKDCPLSTGHATCAVSAAPPEWQPCLLARRQSSCSTCIRCPRLPKPALPPAVTAPTVAPCVGAAPCAGVAACAGCLPPSAWPPRAWCCWSRRCCGRGCCCWFCPCGCCVVRCCGRPAGDCAMSSSEIAMGLRASFGAARTSGRKRGSAWWARLKPEKCRRLAARPCSAAGTMPKRVKRLLGSWGVLLHSLSNSAATDLEKKLMMA